MIFLSKNGIQHLLLKLPIGRNPHELPSSFFTCLQLRHLTLQSGLILPPPSFKGFDRLISLELRDVTISSKLLESLISHSPLLEQLVLQISDVLTDVIEINAPMLRTFDFTGRISCICLKSVPLLEKLSLQDAELYYLKAAEKCDIAKFFEPLSTLEHLHLANLFLSPGAGEIPPSIPFVLHSVKRLCLSGMYFDPLDVVTSALCLIRSFPNLQSMEIQVALFYNDVPAPESLQVERFSNVTFYRLREVKLEGFIGTKPEMQLVELLLAKSPALVRILIKLSRSAKDSARAKILAVLSKIKLASPKAEVDFIF
nr:PREDICTED: F-box/FBD/LRR-repeat protein At1g13570-like isoform X1 [Nicotiana tabacum]